MEPSWITKEEYAQLTGLTLESIDDLVVREKLVAKFEAGQQYIDASKGTQAVVPAEVQALQRSEDSIQVGSQFVEKTIGTIINLHEKVIGAKDETIESVKNENLFLKEALASLQELYEEDRRTIETLTDQIKQAQQEVEFLRRKYKLMWGKVVEDYATTSNES